MRSNNFKSVYPLIKSLYGISMDVDNFEDIAYNGWQLIGNKQTRLHRYRATIEDNVVELPCNVDIIEAVYSPNLDASVSSNLTSLPNTYHYFSEGYSEGFKQDKNPFYGRGALLKYRQEGDRLVFDKNYGTVDILYHGIMLDDDGLPYLTDKEVQALAAYCAYVETYKKGLALKDNNLITLSYNMKTEWQKLCSAARIPDHISQNDMDDILDVRTRWDRKQYGKSYKPML